MDEHVLFNGRLIMRRMARVADCQPEEPGMRLFLSLCALVSIGIVVHTPAGAVEPGDSAPRFELPRFGGGYTASAELFERNELTFLVFWESACSHCVESLEQCEAFYREFGGTDIAVVGVNTDTGDLLRVRRVLETGSITFPQLHDRGAVVAGLYGVPLETFAICLVDGRGVVVGENIDPPGEMRAIMEAMLRTPVAAPASVSVEGSPDLTFRGDERIRFLGIDTKGDAPVGPYGEEVRTGNHVQYRFMLEVSRRLNRRMTVGTLLRISNEGTDVLAAGPDYFGSEWGSAFALLSSEKVSLRVGYYTMHMTPLTLMRWDWDDNPRIGGDTGCGCVPASGVLLVESLERLGPDLTFEGAQAAFGAGNLEMRVFYAMSRRASETSYSEYRVSGEMADYSLELFGAEANLQRRDRRTGRFWKAGFHFVESWENSRSVDFEELGYGIPQPWQGSSTLSLSWEIPVLALAALRGEWLLLNRIDYHMYGIDGERDDLRSDGGGGIAGIVIERERSFRLLCDYVRTEPAFYSPFAALSYEANREGIRTSLTAYLAGEAAALSVFYRRAREIKPPDGGMEREQVSLLGASFDLDLQSGIGGSIGYLDRGSRRTGEIEDFDASRRAAVATLRYLFVRQASIELRYERIETKSDVTGNTLESEANLYSLSVSAQF